MERKNRSSCLIDAAGSKLSTLRSTLGSKLSCPVRMKMQMFLPEKFKLIGPMAPLLKRSRRRINAGVRAYIADTASALYTLNAELNSLSSIAIFLSPSSVGLALSGGRITATEFTRFLNSA